MLTCEHASSLETTLHWTVSKDWNREYKAYTKTTAFPLKFRPTAQCYLTVDPNYRDYCIPLLKIVFCVDGERTDDLMCHLWTDCSLFYEDGQGTEENPLVSNPKDLPSIQVEFLNKPEPINVYCKVFSTKCDLCEVGIDYKEQAKDLNEKMKEAIEELNKLCVRSNKLCLEIGPLQQELVSKDLNNSELMEELRELKTQLAESELRQTEQKLVKIREPELQWHNVEFFETMWKMREEQKFTNFSLDVGGKIISVHKSMLAANSEFFAKQLGDDLTKTTFTIENAKAEVVEAMIEVVYLGHANEFEKYVTELYKLASKFAIPTLKKKCAESLKSTLSLENAADYLILAVENEDQSLSQTIIDYAEERGGKLQLFTSKSIGDLIKGNADLLFKIHKVLSS